MTKQEEREFNALMAYKEMFGDGSFPGVDSLPFEYRGTPRLAELLERCVREKKPLHELIEVREDDPNLIY